jgi:hypothetical protein
MPVFVISVPSCGDQISRGFFCTFCAFRLSQAYGGTSFCGYSLVMQRIPLNDGRRLFGNDPKAYAEARPEYPDELYERLINRCGFCAQEPLSSRLVQGQE